MDAPHSTELLKAPLGGLFCRKEFEVASVRGEGER